MARREGRRSISTLWIFCEGETEQFYFSKLKQDERVKMQVKLSPNKDAPGIIDHAISYKKGHKKDFEKGDVVYCVFDRDKNETDKHGKDQIELAKKFARDNDIKIAFSNPSFEYWILCHFEKHFEPIEKEELERKLEVHLGEYIKPDKNLYTKINKKRNDALSNSRKSVDLHSKKGIVHKDSNPVTNIFEIIDSLDEFR